MPSQQHSSPQQHLPQSQSTVGVTTPMVMVNNPQFQPGLQGHQQPPAQVPPVNQQANYQARPLQCNRQFSQPPLPQVSPLITPPQQYNPKVPPPCIPQYPSSISPSTGSNDSSMSSVFQKQLKMQERRERA